MSKAKIVLELCDKMKETDYKGEMVLILYQLSVRT